MVKTAKTGMKMKVSMTLARPVRRCAACHERRSAADMLRFMRSESGWVWQPPSGHIGGRSLYLCPETKCLNSFRSKLGGGESLAVFLTRLEAVVADYVEKRRLTLKNDNLDSKSKAALRLTDTTKILAALRNGLPVVR